jgi:quinoprotein dehydrogenase-associated probable ABC transporter substrate-binding protein
MKRLCATLAGSAILAALALHAPARATDNPAPHAKFTVCADPGNLPYSNKALEGFENDVAKILADDLGAELDYFWFAQHKGFLGRTLMQQRCDAVLSVPTELGLVAVTRPWFTSSYVAVTRADDARRFASFDDPWLQDARIGLQLVGNEGATTPPAVALSRRGANRNITAFPMWSEDETGAPQGDIVHAVAEGKIDVAFVWGPFAGYFARAHGAALRLEPILADPKSPDQSFVFSMSIGVRKSDGDLRDRLQQALDRHAGAVTAALEAHGVPRVAPPPQAEPATLVRPDAH